MQPIPLLAVVALLDPVSDRELARGSVGTVVEVLAPDVYEVEFGDDEGRTYAVAAMRGEQLLPLKHAPDTKARVRGLGDLGT